MNAVIYARYSSDSQREESIDGQLRECTDYAERNGMTIVGSYIDRALSAKTADRPEFQHMIKDSAKGLFEIVLVWKLDRFSRDRYDSAHYKHILKKNGVKVVSAKEHISDGPEGIILESMLEGYAEFYSAELSEKSTEGKRKMHSKARTTAAGFLSVICWTRRRRSWLLIPKQRRWWWKSLNGILRVQRYALSSKN